MRLAGQTPDRPFRLSQPEHNRAVGRATRSKHTDGAAFDNAISNHNPVAFEAAARDVGFLGFGFYPCLGFIHIDLGPKRQWGERFPIRATAFAEDTPPARDVLAESRGMISLKERLPESADRLWERSGLLNDKVE